MIDFKNLFIIHRGNYSYKYPENSLPAFSETISKNMPIELDVRIIKDSSVVVFHDNNLKRMCGVDKRLDSFNYKELIKYKLNKTDYTIPTFKSVLDLVNGKVLLDIELKSDGTNNDNLETLVINLLKSYNGEYVLKSFDPRIVRHLKKIRKNNRMDFKVGLLLKNNLYLFPFLFFVNPDFICFNYKYLSSYKFKLLSKLKPSLVYTIKNKSIIDNINDYNGGYIVEDYEKFTN